MSRTEHVHLDATQRREYLLAELEWYKAYREAPFVLTREEITRVVVIEAYLRVRTGLKNISERSREILKDAGKYP